MIYPMTRVLDQTEWMPNLEQEVHLRLKAESSGHDPWHAFRVRNLGIQIGEKIGADLDVVCAAALLHDIGHVSGRERHADRAASLAADLLSGCGFPANKISAVTSCIEHHHWLPGRAGDPQNPPSEYQAFADADRLDALGAIGIARTFAFGGAHERPIWEPEPSKEERSRYGISSIHHFYEKLLLLPADMYTKVGRELAASRVLVMENFLRTFYLEWEGKDVQSNSSLLI